MPGGCRRKVEDHPAGDRPAVAQEHGAVARRCRLRLRPVRDRCRAAADLPGLAFRPLEGPDGRDRRIPAGSRGGPRRTAGPGRLDGHGRPRGLGILQHRPSEHADGDPDIKILNNLNNVGAIEVNAFQSQADVCMQKSTREGFGLTVTGGPVEGPRRPSAATSAGSRFRSRTASPATWSARSTKPHSGRSTILKDPELSKRLGRAGKERARERFLTPRLLRDWLGICHEIGVYAGSPGGEARRPPLVRTSVLVSSTSPAAAPGRRASEPQPWRHPCASRRSMPYRRRREGPSPSRPAATRPSGRDEDRVSRWTPRPGCRSGSAVAGSFAWPLPCPHRGGRSRTRRPKRPTESYGRRPPRSALPAAARTRLPARCPCCVVDLLEAVQIDKAAGRRCRSRSARSTSASRTSSRPSWLRHPVSGSRRESIRAAESPSPPSMHRAASRA